MCGLTGILPRSGSKGSLPGILDRMTASLVHRGPDASGAWYDESAGIALGHRRLSILDLSEAGAQPMHSRCGRFVTAFNGEIYNHLELRERLAAEGMAPQWRGHSDTETLLAAIAAWGLDTTLERSSGMFAIALWDRERRRLSLARDRMGEKPLYWGWAGEDIVFASELKALRAHPQCSSAMSHAAVQEFIGFSYVPAPLSILEGVFKLEPGTIADFGETPPAAPPRAPLRPGESHGTVTVRRYWDLGSVVDHGLRAPLTDRNEALDTLEATLRDAVSRQMLSDVPLGAFLSGGIDSSLITALMQSVSSAPVRSFTIGFEQQEFNEAPHAAAVAAHLGTDHTELTVTDADARAVIPVLPDMYDEPFADSSQIPTHLVCKAARAHVTVALSGDGGDELFGGYNRYLWGPRLWSRIALMPPVVRRALGGTIEHAPQRLWDFAGALAGVNRPAEKALKLGRRLGQASSPDAFYRSLLTEWNGTRLTRFDPQASALPVDDPVPAGLAGDFAGRMMLRDMRGYLPDDILCKVDRAAMAVSLETRVPFLDPDVIALSARWPTDWKLHGGEAKWPLRQILFRHVPRSLIERPKAGFAIPIGHWLRGPLHEWAEDLLQADRLAADGLIDPVPVRAAWHAHLSGKADWTPALWSILMLQAWRDRWT